MELKTGSFYEYGPFRLEPAEHRLTREGSPVSLSPKAFDLLVFLVENRGRLVTKDQIMEAVWPGSFVEDANLTVWISVLRKALGEKGGSLRYIETVPKRGYRFMAPVKEVAGPEPPIESLTGGSPRLAHLEMTQPPRTFTIPASTPSGYDRSQTPGRMWRITAAGVVVLALILAVTGYFTRWSHNFLMKSAQAPHSLAILPLRNLREDPQDDFLGFSLADTVITRLGAVTSLTVRPSSAIERYKGQAIDVAKVATELNVDTLLTGTFIHDGDDLRITYQLIDARTQRILARDVIDLKYKDLLAVQDDVTQKVIKTLALNLSPAEAARIKPYEPVNSLAYESYLRGVDLVGSHEFPMAIKMLEKSAEMDPNYAPTWAYLGQSYNSAASFEFGGREQYQKAQAAFERALALEPNQLEASIFLANLLIDTGRVEQAVPLLRNTARTNPNNAAVHWELG